MEEIWKDIYYYDFTLNRMVDYRNIYQVSNLGNVKSLKTNKNRKFYKNNRGYLYVQLYKENTFQTFLVHRIVAFMFIPNNDKTKTQINHINEFEKDNNTVDNLEWCTNDYNCHYGTHNKRISDKLKNRKDQSIPVISINIKTGELTRYDSINDTGRISNNCPSKVSACCKGKRKTHNGCKWYYEEDYLSMATLSEAELETIGTCND